MSQDSPAANFRNRIRQWALRRQGPDHLPLTLAARRIYILPTAAGWTFALLVVVMFVAAMNYGNGLAMLLAFWLGGFLMVAMVQTQRTLAGGQLLSASAAPAFAGEPVLLQLQLTTRGAIADLTLTLDQDARRASHMPSQSSSDTLLLPVPTRRRGPWRAPVICLSSQAPFGLFRTWTWLSLDVATVVYPRAVGDLPIPEVAGDQGGAEHLASGQDELAWLRDFREGDSPRQVAWKAYARGAPLLVREYRSSSSVSRDFDFATLPIADTEIRLSQLARWAVDAAARAENWSLRLPGRAPLHGAGPDHLQQCLQDLALFDLREPAR